MTNEFCIFRYLPIMVYMSVVNNQSIYNKIYSIIDKKNDPYNQYQYNNLPNKSEMFQSNKMTMFSKVYPGYCHNLNLTPLPTPIRQYQSNEKIFK
jgi:hypothetical protein